MLFNSIDFAVFLPLVFSVYWIFQGKFRHQNLILIIASYIFYGWWDWRFLSLIIFSTVLDFTIGKQFLKQKNRDKRKILLWISVFFNLGILLFFKYYNFFLDNFLAAFTFFGKEIEANSLSIVLPIGISFYTFQTMSYTIDIYRGKLEPSNDFIAFSAFVCFFPQLVAGPIERATNLLPQFNINRNFDYAKAVCGLRQMLWGLFKKIVIADNCAEYANQIFNNSDNMNGSSLALGAMFFTFQIYCDFSGYSDIAIGTSRLFGFNLKQNFAFPYFSRDIAEFWRRWHISLSTWFRDYLYIPLGGSRGGTYNKVRNTFIVFLVSGFWHGANWTFIVWGFLNALYFLPLLLTNKNRNNIEVVAKGKMVPSFIDTLRIIRTFCLTALAWIIFRADNINHSFNYISGIFSSSIFEKPNFSGLNDSFIVIILTILFLIIEWIGREEQFALSKIGLNWWRPIRFSMYYVLILIIAMFGGKEQEFIYFQF